METTTPALLPGQVAGDRASTVHFKTSQGVELQASALRLTPDTVTFEAYLPGSVLQLSEVLTGLKINRSGRLLYEGQAVITGMINVGTATVCQATLSGPLPSTAGIRSSGVEQYLPGAFKEFLDTWQKCFRVTPAYKIAVADLQSFLHELQLWLDPMDLGIQALPAPDRARQQRALLQRVPVAPALNDLFERFERAAAAVPEELVPAHRAYCRQQLHRLLLCAPFMYRIFIKPLGYAGDYEMIDMIMRHDYEGDSLFAKLLHAYILDQAPARSVRNRAKLFKDRFVVETNRVSHLGRVANIFCLGCGPAREVQDFVAESPLANEARFRLLDFNEETLHHATARLQEVKRKSARRTQIEVIKKSVQALLKEAGRPTSEEGYDFIYCSGLYDYLNDRVCQTLNTYLYHRLRPGGLMVVTNFDPYNPIKNIMEHMFEWFLIHRDGKQMLALCPEQASPEDCEVWADPTSCNVFLEVRKPAQRK